MVRRIGLLAVLISIALAFWWFMPGLPEVRWPGNFGWNPETTQQFAATGTAEVDVGGRPQAFRLQSEQTLCRVLVKQASLQEYRAVTELELLRVEQIVERSSRYRRYPNDAITGELSLPNGERLTLESEQIAAFLPPSRSLRYGLLLIYIFDTPILQPSSGNENQVRVILCSAYAKPQ